MPEFPPAPPSLVPSYESQPVTTPPLSQPHYGAPFSAAFKHFWLKYATFTGRASRAEFWWWALAYFGINVLAVIVMTIAGGIAGGGVPHVMLVVFQTVWTAATIVPFAALSWRRLHDSNYHGWWALPFVVLSGLQATLNAFGLQSVLNAATYNGNPTGIAVSVTTGILSLACGVLMLVLTTRPSREGGVRFDR